MIEKGHVPIRMCIGCRKKKKKEEMIRLTQSSEGVLWMDERKRHHGRGFYLCPDFGCINIAKKKNRGIRFLEPMNFLSLSMEGFFQRMKKCGIEEEGNDKE